MKIFSSLLLFLSLMLTSTAHAGWQNYKHINSNYFEGTGDGHRIVLTLDGGFHDCGWNDAVNIHLSDVGEVAFQTYVSVVLAAIVANKKISVNTNGCVGDRARGVALRLAK